MITIMGLSYFLFPFEKVEKDARVIIYGAGEAGRCYWNQLNLSMYCLCEAIVDINYKEFRETNLPVYGLEYLDTAQYDYIVMSIDDGVIAKKAFHNLLNMGIDEEKIILSRRRGIPQQYCPYDLDFMVRSKENTKKTLSMFFKKGEGGIIFFKYIQKELKERMKEDYKRYYDYFNEYLSFDKSIKNRILLLRLLYGIGFLDSHMFQELIRLVKEIESSESKFWLLWDISVMELNNSKLRYPQYYHDKRELNASIANNIFNRVLFKEIYDAKEKSIDRVAIVVYTMRKITDSHMQLVIPYACEMAEQGKEVAVVFTDLLNYSFGDSFMRPIYAFRMDSKPQNELFIKATNNKVKPIYAEGESITERLNDFMIKLAEYAPGIIFDMSSEYSYVSSLYKEYFPTVCVAMRGYCSSASFHKYIARDKILCRKENTVFPFCEDNAIEEVLICNEFPKAVRSHTRVEYGLNDKDFVMVTVGARLNAEISLEMADKICGMLRSREDIKWLCVGSGYIASLARNYEDLMEKHQIILWDHEPDLMGMYEICDVYVNPIRMGGGTSIAWAMKQGVPIAILDFPADIIPRIGRENLIKGGYEEMVEYLWKLYLNPDFKKNVGKQMIAKTEISSKKKSVEKILDVGNRLYNTMNGENV